ncbi:MAG TPA: DUF1559 domain-containing protein [Thermoguttaceae bacterium]|nr:DUF1559 domain-containing protein [Thermoguttaceae bacterium]
MTLRPKKLRPRAGFTLVELLVVIGIIGMLLGLLLPAVQAVRSTARRMSCKSNLHQIGVALLAYHDTHGSFPPGGMEPISPKWPKGRQLAWSAFILPQLEQQSLHGRIDFNRPFNSPENAEAAAEVVSTYLCPSVDRTSNLVDGRAACDYGGIYGERIDYEGRPAFPPLPNNPPKGTMLYDRPIKLRQILDGKSTTLLVSEDGGWRDGQWINGLNIFDQAYAINQAPAFENDIRSDHSGGANALFADGSARFLDENMELAVLAAICTREGEEIVDDF